MPAWWRGISKSKSKSKSNPNSNSSPRKKKADEEEDEVLGPTVKHSIRASKKEKAKSFDEILHAKKTRDPSSGCGGGGDGPGSPFAFESDAERRGHPLPRPSSLPLPHDHGATAASVSVSSVSSSVSSDETPDLGFCRYSDPINMPRGRAVKPDSRRQQHVAEDGHLFSCSPVLEHARCSNLSISPRKESRLYSSDTYSNGTAYSHRQTSTETIFNPRSTSFVPGSRGHPFPTSPIHPRAFGISPESPTRKQDDLRSPPHPLPLPPSSPSTSTPRSLQSRWKKGRLIGRGTFGHVYVGFNSDSGQMCAIKEVNVISDDSNSKESLKQLNQEITLLSQLSHPNIVQYYGSELTEDTLSVYLEYVSGGSIHKLLQEYGPFREPVIRCYAGQILSGLAYLHGRNTVHRDIKGANILVDPNGEVKLVDFGMAKHISSYTSVRSFKGSPYWMAPEVIMNGSGYNLSVDIWSLGCTILEMATSKPPWSQYEGVAAIFKIANSKDIPEIPSNISSDGKDFLKLCLQRDPSARPTAAQLMDHPFIRDHATIKVAKFNMVRDVFPSSSDESHTPTTTEFSSNRSVSPLLDRDYGMRHTVAFSAAYNKNPSDLFSLRMNMSLPVSPCSSPLRQFRPSNRSCLPSPPHPAYSVGGINFGLSNYSLDTTRTCSNYQDPWPDIQKAYTPYDSPRT